jgi:superfamily II DNA/RNA helicase
MQNETNPNTSTEQSTGETQQAAPVIKHSYYEVGTDVLSKPNALCDILEVDGCPPTTIFCNTPSDADLVEVVLKKRGIAALKLIGHVPPMRTARALKQVKSGEIACLVVTDVSGQSLDVEELEMVVNYSLPSDPEVYIHRCGHSRPGAKLARVVSLIAALDIANLHYLRKIVEFQIDKVELPSKEQLSTSKLANIRKQAIELASVKDDRISELTWTPCDVKTVGALPWGVCPHTTRQIPHVLSCVAVSCGMGSGMEESSSMRAMMTLGLGV